MATEKQLNKLLNDMTNPNSSLFPFVGKRGLDEILGKDYNILTTPIKKIRSDIMRLGKKKTVKKKKVMAARKGGLAKRKK